MNYYIDFEATQWTQEIIEIGCIDDDGREFHSYVRAKKVGQFVSDLTGITDEVVRSAPSADEVFQQFFDYIFAHYDRAKFYCYGDCDIVFCKNTKNKVSSLKAQLALDLLINNMVDYSPYTKEFFGLAKNISLIKVVQYFDSTKEQDHNALNDAKLLKFATEKVSTNVCEDDPFPEYKEIIVRTIDGKTVGTHMGLDNAANWLKSNLQTGNQGDVEHIKHKIQNAINSGRHYCGFGWKNNL